MTKSLLYVLTAHATTVITERGISEEWLARTLGTPEFLESDARDPNLRHALCRIRERDMRMLRVVYNHRSDPRRVVTAFFDRRRSRR